MSKSIKNPFSTGLHTLERTDISADKLVPLFGWKKPSLEAMLQRFIYLNKKALEYLGIQASIVQQQSKIYLSLVSSQYVGTVPLFSPSNGKPFCDLSIVGRYNEEVGEIIDLLSDTISIEYSDTLCLHDHSEIKSPIYLECCKFIDKYIIADRYNWTKFSRVHCTEPLPHGITDWNKYAKKSQIDPAKAIHFDNTYSISSKNHKEWHQLNYVLLIAISIISNPTTSIRIKTAYSEKMAVLMRNLQESVKLKVDQLRINGNDPSIVKELKKLGNIILTNEQKVHMAWRIDYSEFFERYVQFIIRKAAILKGGRSIENAHIPIKAKNRPAWGLLYLEPDIIYNKDDLKVIIDAKYKSHIFNWDSSTEDLKTSFRYDLHQVLAYCSFSSAKEKHALIVYPYTNFTSKEIDLFDPYSNNTTIVHLVGVPMSKLSIENSVKGFLSLIESPHS